MAFRVWKTKKPILSLSLEAGGSLAADTTYYFTGYYTRAAVTRSGGAFGPIADEVNITTDSTNRSIKIHHKIIGSFTSVESYDSGNKIKVISADHCLWTDDIDISGSTNYNGSWTVEEVLDYDSFVINTAFIADDSGDWETTGGKPSLGYTNGGLMMTMDTVPIVFSTSGPKWSHGAGSWGYQTQDFIVTTPYTQLGYREMMYYHPQILGEYIDSMEGIEIGRLYIEFDDTTYDKTVSEFVDDLRLTDYFEDYFEYGAGIFILNAYISWDDAVTIPFQGLTIIYYGAHYGIGDLAGLTYERCQIRWDQVSATYSTIRGNLTDCHIVTGLKLNELNSFSKCLLTRDGSSLYWMFKSWEDTDAHLGGYTITFYQSVVGNWVKNANVGRISLQFPWNYANLNDPELAELQNVYIDATTGRYGNLYYAIHPSYTDPDDVVDFLNLTSLDEYVTPFRSPASLIDRPLFKFWFSFDLKVVDSDGAAVVGATVKVTDTEDTEYSDTTDVNGKISLYVVGYRNEPLPVGPPESAAKGTTVDLNPFVLTIEKSDFATYTQEDITIMNAYNQTIALQELIPPLPETIIYGAELYGTTIY